MTLRQGLCLGSQVTWLWCRAGNQRLSRAPCVCRVSTCVLSLLSSGPCASTLDRRMPGQMPELVKVPLGRMEGLAFPTSCSLCPCTINPSLKLFADVRVDRIVKILPFIKPRTKEFHYSARPRGQRLRASPGPDVGAGSQRSCFLSGFLLPRPPSGGLGVT